jgi:hypothetical protein
MVIVVCNSITNLCKKCELLVHIQVKFRWKLVNMLINIHEKCTVNHATIPLQIYWKYMTIVKFHCNFPKILSQIYKKFYGKTQCESYSRYIKNTQVLLLQIQFKFLLEVFRDAVKKSGNMSGNNCYYFLLQTKVLKSVVNFTRCRSILGIICWGISLKIQREIKREVFTIK